MSMSLPAMVHADNAQPHWEPADAPLAPRQPSHAAKPADDVAREHAFAGRMRMWDAVAEVRRETAAFVRRMPEYRRQHEATVGVQRNPLRPWEPCEGPLWVCSWRETAGDLAGFAETLHVLGCGMVRVGEVALHLSIPEPDDFQDAHGLLTARIRDFADRVESYLATLNADEPSPLTGERPGDAFYSGLRCAAWAARQVLSVMDGEVNSRRMEKMMAVLEAAEIEAEWPGLASA